MKINFNNTYLELGEKFYSKTKPDSVKNPVLIKYNTKLSQELNIEKISDENIIKYLSWNKILEWVEPLAQVYAGHQFWHYSPRLWDGRAVLLWEIIDINNFEKDIVLKWSGETLYSRWWDGKATLWSVIREYVMSEAMYNLWIPTTRSLAIVSTGEVVFREKIKPGGILTRVASSHIRFWTFEYFLRSWDLESLENLADYSISRHYSEIENFENKYELFFQKVIEKQIDLVVNWMRVGFIHGVMNTDNMLISWETIDYGPCAFMDNYNKNTVFSSIDENGRYSFMNQKYALEWNLARFWETLIPLISNNTDESVKIIEKNLENFRETFDQKYFKMMNNKIWIFNEKYFDNSLVQEILEYLEKNKLDYTDFFRILWESIWENKINIWEFKILWQKLEKILLKQDINFQDISNQMQKINPQIIPRNYKVENAIFEAENNNDFSAMEKIIEITKNPYTNNIENREYMKDPEFVDKNYKTYCGT